MLHHRKVASTPKTLSALIVLVVVIVAFFGTLLKETVLTRVLAGQKQPLSGISITTLGVPITQNFDTLPASGSATWVNDSTLPGWYHARTGTGTTIVANDGSSTAGNLYSYGTGTNTDRALGSIGSGNAAAGSFFWGILLTNNSGSTITSLDVSYVGEQWRNSAAAAQTASFSYLTGSALTGSLAEFQTAGTSVPSLDFTSPITGGTAGALNGNLAANRTALGFTISSLTLADGQQIMLRWSDPDHTGSDHGLSIDDFSVTANGSGGGGMPTLNIGDVTQIEGDSGTTTFNFNVSLTAPAGAGGVTFTVDTADGTTNPATAGSDYVAIVSGSGSISQGNTSTTVSVTVNGDTTPETNETFFVNISNVVGATLGDGQGLGTITNDDFTLTPIHDIQGSGNTSPFVGQTLTTSGIVTGVKSNGFFIQAPDAQVDADPNTSEGVFVFTSSAPPAAAAVGNSVAAGGTGQEFIPSADVNSPPATELGGTISVTLLSTGNPLPAPITITAAATLVNDINNLEKYEGMRVHADSITTISGTQGSVNEPNATSTSNGVFYAVVTGVARPFREPGIQVPDPLPGGSPCCIPRFDSNPERLRVDSDGLVGAAVLEVTTGATIANVTGPLDYAFRTYTILPDVGTLTQGSVVGNVSFTAVPVPNSDEFTVASFNMERFFDTVNDGNGAPTLTATAFNNRLNKASLAIRNVMRTPDILGIEEMENLTTLQAVATKINNDAVGNGDPNPMYQAYLSEGNDIGGIDVGFLVKSSRVTVIDVTQFGLTTTYINPNNGMPELLNDRPPLVLRATVANGGGSPFAITVIVNHLRSLSGIDDPTDGNRVRTKRRAQAEYLANLIQGRQMSDPHERIISVGDYNVFQFNDGYVDSIGTIKGTPALSNQVVLASSDLVNPDLIDLISQVTPASQQYSYSFDGDAQVLDHELITANLMPHLTGLAYARNDADFPESFRSDPNRPERLSDHDMAVAYFTESCLFALNRDHESFAGGGGTGTVNVTAITGCAWTASTSSSFITINSGSMGAGDGVVGYTVAPNAGTTMRSDTITIGGKTFTVYQGMDFLDVPSDSLFYTEIGKLAARGVTLGCTQDHAFYCPNDPVLREQMAAFILRAKGEFSPPDPASQRFTDVPPTNVFYNFIDRLAVLNITLGCTPDHMMYCPGDPVTRGQIAAFLVRAFDL